MPRYDSKQWDRDAILRRLSTASWHDFNEPEQGHYRIRKAKGAIWVPVLIYRPCACTIHGPAEHYWTESCDRFPPLAALVDGWEELRATEVWDRCWESDREEYETLVAAHEGARLHSPQSPDARPTMRDGNRLMLRAAKVPEGTFQMRLIPGGVYVPVLMWRPCECGHDGQHAWTESCSYRPPVRALVDGWRDTDPLEIWTECKPIPAPEYDHLVAAHAWAREHSPDHPDANPSRPVDLTALPSIF